MDERSWMEKGLDPGPEPFPIPGPTPRVEPNVRVRMRDGAELVGDLYVPVGRDGPYPAILERTPYGAQRSAYVGRRYARIGYLFLALDVRGRYRSGGTFEPLVHERDDGHDAIEWLAAHELCDGRVGTRGESYAGTIQLLAAAARPPALRAMVVTAAPGDPFDDVPFQGGAWDVGDIDWLLTLTGRTDASDWLAPFEEEDDDDDGDDEDEPAKPSAADLREREIERLERRLTLDALRARPFRDLDIRLGVRCPAFREWTRHWRWDAFWERHAVLPHAHEIGVPTLHVSGVWDGNGRGAPTFYRALRERAATAEAREHQRLLIGPWTHDQEAPFLDDLPQHARRAVERGALRDPMNDEVAWFEKHVRGVDRADDARVEWYLTGAERWIELPDWPPETSERVFFLHPRRGDGDGHDAGALMPEPPRGDLSVEYTADPDDPAPFASDAAEGDRAPFDTRATPTEGRGDVLDLTSARLGEPLTVLGDVRAEIWWSADAPDGDLYAQLIDVHPDGRAVFLTDGVLRARFREGFDREVPLPDGEPVRLMLDLWHAGHVFHGGHRVRLRLQPAALDRFDVNPGTGGSLADETEGRTATHRVHGGPDRASRLILPELRL